MNRRSFVAAMAAVSSLFSSSGTSAAAGSTAEQKLRDLGLTLTDPATPIAVYVPFRIVGNQVFIAGQIPPLDADIPTTGKVGSELSVEQGYAAARLAGLKVLAQLRVACDGDLDRVVQALQIRGFVNCSADFDDQPKAMLSTYERRRRLPSLLTLSKLLDGRLIDLGRAAQKVEEATEP
jgi:enamine deaminase RidA (YjgF/YER057c/UK114 family)